MGLPHVEFPASMSCNDNREGGDSSKEEKERDKTQAWTRAKFLQGTYSLHNH